jgi:hypothetical protein
MKQYLVILALISAGISACGMHRPAGAKDQLESSEQRAAFEVKASLLTDEIKQLNAESLLGRYYFFAKINPSEIPQALRGVSSESPIGTLSLIQRSTVYRAEYEENYAKHEVQKSAVLKDIPVTLFNFNQSNHVYLAVALEHAKHFQKNAHPVSVQVHKVDAYCSKLSVAWTHRGPYYMKDQQVSCDAAQRCFLRLHYEKSVCPGLFCGGGYNDIYRPISFVYEFGGKCFEWKGIYERTETLVNQYDPEHAIVTMSPQLGLKLKQINIVF